MKSETGQLLWTPKWHFHKKALYKAYPWTAATPARVLKSTDTPANSSCLVTAR